MIFDRLTLDDVNRAAQVHEYASGKSPNVARVLQTLGADAVEVGFAGGDRGRFLLQDLAQAGIRCEFVTINAQTRLCTTVIDRAAGTATELVEEHAAVPAEAWREMDARLERLLPGSKTWVFSGSLPPGAPRDFYARWIPLARRVGATLILDTRGEPLTLALKEPGFIAKLNRDELAGTLRTPLADEAAVIAAARRIAPAGGAAIVTGGPRGVIACEGGRVWHLAPPMVQAISAVGSGDAFAAGLAVALSRGEPFPQALALAAACGAANAMTPLAGHLNLADVQSLRARAVVREVTA